MVLDTSALVAMLTGEPGADELIDRLAQAHAAFISAGTLLEASIVLEVRLGEEGLRDLSLFLQAAGVTVVPVDAEQVEVARDGYARFGKGRHPAGLNFGDVFAYALARLRGQPLLYVGEDFTRTDVLRA
jgi:ribonuclease VapC